IRKMAVVQLISVLLSFALAGLAQCSCPAGFEEISSCCYYFSSDHGVKDTWSNARDYCQELGDLLGGTVNLAEVGYNTGCNDDMLMVTVSSKASGVGTWFGAKDDEEEDHWVWQQSGKSFSLTSNMWWYDEPDHVSGYSNCLHAYTGYPGGQHRAYFGDKQCNNVIEFVCQ
ncbi:unnamed protein product, partial [Meganyctiphanes norvegica]